MARAEGVPAFTMNQLAAFVAVAEGGTISGAAERLHVSASALSASVTELERALQTQLLHRRKAKGVSLTPAGELVLPRARHLLYQASELEADARGDERGVAAVDAAQQGAATREVAALLAERDARAIAARVAGLRERGGPVRDAFRSFGTCSIDDPRDELTALGLLDPTPHATDRGAR